MEHLAYPGRYQGNVPVNGAAGFTTAEESVTNDVMRAFSEMTTELLAMPLW